MAVDEQKPKVLIRDFWPRYNKRSRLILISTQIISGFIVGLSLVVSGNFSLSSVELWTAVLAVTAAGIGINIVMFPIITEPMKDLSNALTHVAGEPTVTTPPNPNSRRYAKSGLKQMLELIYELGAQKGEVAPTSKTDPTSVALQALNNTICGMIVLSSKGAVQYANSKAPVHLDKDGVTVNELLFDEHDPLEAWLRDCEENAVHAERTWPRIANMLPGEEGRRIFDVFATYEKGSTAEVVLVLVDRTGEYAPEEEDLDFIAFAAHELRGPITVIRGYLDVLNDEIGENLKDDQVELIKRLIVSANRLSSYVNNILNASRYDRRHLKVYLREEKLDAIYDTIADDMQLRAVSQGRLLAVAFPSDLPTIAADRGSIGEVLGNLIDNAIKYSNEGGAVNVTAGVVGDFVEVSVEDHGIGMPGNVVSNLFHKFYRSHRSRETVAGTGIGLYISKAIVESHGGTISVRSTEGQGSVFTFSLPVYSTVAEKLQKNDNSNENLIERGGGWIKNHSMFRG